MENFWTFIRSVNNKWGSDFRGQHDKKFAYVLLIILIFFSILDRAIDWDNYSQLCSSEFKYALATGPVNQTAKDGLLSFAIIGLFSCAIEILNSLTLLCCQGHTVFPIEIEQGGILLLEQIPQAIINLAVAICRNNFVTSLQGWQCFWGLINTSLRLYAYGYAKEKWFPVERAGLASTKRIAVYITTTFLWLFLVFNNIFLWHHAKLGHYQFHQVSSAHSQLDGVSVALERTATHAPPRLNATLAYQMMQNWHQTEDKTPWLVQDIGDIARSRNQSRSVVYKCRWPLRVFEPKPCMDMGTEGIKFEFRYVLRRSKFNLQPAGELQYNYAILSDNTNTNCYYPNKNVLKEWRLEFYRFEKITIPYTLQERLQAHQAWENVCVTPEVKYNPSIIVC